MSHSTETALQIRSDQLDLTEQQAQALGVLNADPASRAMFIHHCVRTQLDPLSRQIYLITRQGKSTIQISIDGARILRDRSARAQNITVWEQPTTWFTNDGREVDFWVFDEPPAAARYTLVTSDGRQFSAVARFAEYAQVYNGKAGGLWGKMPATMIAKCAEALAIRKAFPADLSGLYTTEEMQQAGAGDQPTAAKHVEQAPEKMDLTQWFTAADKYAAAGDLDNLRSLYGQAQGAGLIHEQGYGEYVAKLAGEVKAAREAAEATAGAPVADPGTGEIIDAVLDEQAELPMEEETTNG